MVVGIPGSSSSVSWGLSVLYVDKVTRSEFMKFHKVTLQNGACTPSLPSLLPHFIVDIWKMGSGSGWEKELSAEGYNLISLLALSGNGLSLGAQIGV